MTVFHAFVKGQDGEIHRFCVDTERKIKWLCRLHEQLRYPYESSIGRPFFCWTMREVTKDEADYLRMLPPQEKETNYTFFFAAMFIICMIVIFIARAIG